MPRSAHPPVRFDQSLIAYTYFCSGDIKQMICCSLFSSPSSISSASVALPSTQLGEVSERIRDGLLSVFLKKCPFQFYQSWSERHLCMITSDEQISSPRLVGKQNSLYLHSLCVDILFNSLPREIIDVTSDVSTWSKNRKRAGTMGRGKRRLLFPLPFKPRALSFSPLPSLPTTQGGLWGG